MSTSNPKVSAYIPQHIYDSFKSFYEQRGISMSQAVAVIFAEYFGLDSSVDQKSSTSGLLVERVGLLEQELADLRELVQKHLQSGGAVNEKEHLVVHNGGLPEAVSSDVAEPTSITPSEPPKEDGLSEAELLKVLENVEASSVEGDLPENTPSESVGEDRSELPVDADLPKTESAEVKSSEVIENIETSLVGGDAPEITPGELDSNLPSKTLDKNELPGNVNPETVPAQESLGHPSGLLFFMPGSELPSAGNSQDAAESVEDAATRVEVDNPLYNLLGEPLNEINPIPGIKLSKLRFGLSEAMIAGKKRDKSLEEFTKWTKDRDPDGIAWKYVLTPSKGYLPVDELSSELRDKLLTWIRENGLV
jgi:hypothetical protein